MQFQPLLGNVLLPACLAVNVGLIAWNAWMSRKLGAMQRETCCTPRLLEPGRSW